MKLLPDLWHCKKKPACTGGLFMITISIDRRICSNNLRRIRLLPQDKSFRIHRVIALAFGWLPLSRWEPCHIVLVYSSTHNEYHSIQRQYRLIERGHTLRGRGPTAGHIHPMMLWSSFSVMS